MSWKTFIDSRPACATLFTVVLTLSVGLTFLSCVIHHAKRRIRRLEEEVGDPIQFSVL